MSGVDDTSELRKTGLQGTHQKQLFLPRSRSGSPVRCSPPSRRDGDTGSAPGWATRAGPALLPARWSGFLPGSWPRQPPGFADLGLHSRKTVLVGGLMRGLARGLALALIVGIAMGLVVGIANGLVSRLAARIGFGLAVGLTSGLASAFTAWAENPA
jgi:hypothetical protein